MANLFIPTTIKVGFQERPGTFTGKLAYVIYYDEKGKLRKETSWKSWCTDKLGSVEFENTPMNGFMFNKGIQRSSEWFGSGRSVFRVYAPHDFEFEINADNLMNLLMHSDVSKREISEQCVFAWHGTELILLPTNSVEYQESITYTEKQSQKVSAKELVKGRQYYKKKSEEVLTYIGHFPWWTFGYENGNRRSYYSTADEHVLHKNTGKKHVFWTGTTFEAHGATVLSSAVSDDIVDDYAELVDKFYTTKHSQSIKGYKIELGTIKADNDSNYIRYPDMYDIQGNRIRKISVNANYYNHITFDKLSIHEQFKEIEIEGSGVRFKAVTWRTPSAGYYYRDSYTGLRDATSEIKSKLAALTETKEYNLATLTPDQYVELMTELGFGQAKLIMENGQEIGYKGFYNYYY